MAKTIDARTLYAKLEGPEEIALIDVREQAPYAASHPILAANIPLGRLELLVGEGGTVTSRPPQSAAEHYTQPAKERRVIGGVAHGRGGG